MRRPRRRQSAAVRTKRDNQLCPPVCLSLKTLSPRPSMMTASTHSALPSGKKRSGGTTYVYIAGSCLSGLDLPPSFLPSVLSPFSSSPVSVSRDSRERESERLELLLFPEQIDLLPCCQADSNSSSAPHIFQQFAFDAKTL